MNYISGVVLSVIDSAENFRAMKSAIPAGLLLIDKDTLVIKVGDGTKTWDELPTREITNISVTDSINENTGGMVASDYAVYKAFHNQPNITDVLKSSGVYTAKITGWHEITVIGGGGGGAAGIGVDTVRSIRGASGGSGAIVKRNVWLTKDTEYNYIIGAGGIGGTFSKTYNKMCIGSDGGSSSFTISENVTIVSEGGKGGGILPESSETMNHKNIVGVMGFVGSGIDAGYPQTPGYRVDTWIAEMWPQTFPGSGNTEEYNTFAESTNTSYNSRAKYTGLGWGGYGGPGGFGLTTNYYSKEYTACAHGHDGASGVIIIRYNNQEFNVVDNPVEQINYFE